MAFEASLAEESPMLNNTANETVYETLEFEHDFWLYDDMTFMDVTAARVGFTLHGYLGLVGMVLPILSYWFIYGS